MTSEDTPDLPNFSPPFYPSCVLTCSLHTVLGLTQGMQPNSILVCSIIPIISVKEKCEQCPGTREPREASSTVNMEIHLAAQVIQRHG
jgi:hypothetical protein